MEEEISAIITNLKAKKDNIDFENMDAKSLASQMYYRILQSNSIIFSIIATIMFLFFYISILTGFLPVGDKNNAFPVMSTIAQSQAAIMAIIVSLTLVAVQLTSQRYSPRIVSIFLKKRDFWIFIGLYSISILYDILVLWVVNDFKYFGILIYIGIILMILSLSVLFVYVRNTITTLEPTKAVEMIANDIKPDKIDKYVNNKYNRPNDPIITVLDIINGAINRYDEYTVINGIDGIVHIFESTIRVISLEYSCPLEVKIDDKENMQKNEYFESIIIYFGEIITDITLNCIKKRLKSATIHSIDALEKMFNIIANNEDYNRNSAFQLVYNAYIIDDEICKFLDKEGYKDKIADPKLIEMITYSVRSIGNMSSKAIQRRIDVTSYTADYEIGMLEEIANTSINKGQEFRTFSDIYEKYEQDHRFVGPKRLLAVLRSLIEINGKIIEILPDLKNKENFKRWENNTYRIEQSFLHKYIIIIELLRQYGEIAIQNEWNGITEYLLKSMRSNLYRLILKGYFTVEYDYNSLKTTSESIMSLIQSIGYHRNLTTSNAIVIWLKENMKILIQKKIRGWHYLIEILNLTYSVTYDKDKDVPIGIINNLPNVIGEIGMCAIRNGFLDEIEHLTSYYVNMARWGTNMHSWKFFVKTIISYMALWGTKLVQMNKDEESKIIMKGIRTIEKEYENRGHHNFVKDALNEIENEKEFLGVYVEKPAPLLGSISPRIMKDDELDIFNKFRNI